MTKSRNEKILENILGADNTLDSPVSRIEVLLLELLDLVQSLQVTAESDGEGTVTLNVEGGEK